MEVASPQTRTDSGSHHPRVSAVHHDAEAARWALAQEEARGHLRRKRASARRSYAYAIGRMLLAAPFLVGAVAKLFTFDAAAESLADLGLSAVRMLVGIAIAVELLGGLALILGYQVRRVAVLLVGYLAAVTLLVHSDFSVGANVSFALANLALAGALVMTFGHGAGVLSIDHLRERKAREHALGA